jgi:hypothetical protein
MQNIHCIPPNAIYTINVKRPLSGRALWRTEMKKSETTPKPSASVEALVGIVEIVLKARDVAKPTLGEIARIAGRASVVLLRISNVDERISVENAAIMAIAKRRNLLLTEA